MKKLLITIMMLQPMMANAYDFEKDGIYYNITSLQELTVEVTSGNNRYEGNITIPATVEYSEKTFNVVRIGEKAFLYSGITGIELPHSILTVGVYAFRYCYQLSSITIPSSITSFEPGAFGGCSGLNNVIIEDGDEQLSMPYNEWQVENISYFNQCDVHSLYYGRNVYYDNSYYYGGLFWNKNNLKSIIIGPKVTQLGTNLFRQCRGLEVIEIPSNVKTIGRSTFEDCSSLKDVIFHEGLQEIWTIAFKNCKSLDKLVLPSTLTQIGTEAFVGCTAITKVYSKITEPFDIAESTFAGITYLNGVLYVPVGTKSLYQERTGWKDFASIVETDDFDNILNFCSANVTVSNGGTVVCNGVDITNTKMSTTIKEDDDISLQIIPDNSYRLASLIVNGNDVTDNVADGVYTIKNVKSDVEIIASFERYFDVGNLTKVVDFIMNSTASAEDIVLYDLNNNEKLDIGDVILIVKFILNYSNNTPNFVRRRAGEVADLTHFTAAQFEVRTAGNVNIENIRLVKSMEQTHQLMYQQKNDNTYAVVVYSMSNQLMQPENGKIIEIGNNLDILGIENVTVATPTGETAYYHTLSATTGIMQMERENGTTVIYDLKGNRLKDGRALEKGFFIVNGKKTVVR